MRVVSMLISILQDLKNKIELKQKSSSILKVNL